MKKHELERKPKEAGCYFIMHGKKHDHWYSPISGQKFMIARHGAKEIPNGTLRSISEQSGVVLY